MTRISQVWGWEPDRGLAGLRSGHGQGWALLGAPGKNQIPAFPNTRGTASLHSWPLPPPSQPQHILFQALSLTFPPLSREDLEVTSGPRSPRMLSQLQVLHSVPPGISPLLWMVT